MNQPNQKIKPATPLPWETRPTRNGFLGEESSMKGFGNDLNAVEPKMYGGTNIINGGIPPMDAAYIVHACNRLPALEDENRRLREALRFVAERPHADDSEDADEINSMIDRARALLRELGAE